MSRHTISGWRNYTFSEIAKKEKFAIVDGPFGTQLHSDEYTENGVPVVRIENLSFSGKFKPENIVFISEKKADQLKRSRVVPGDLIIAKTGATIGKSGMFPDAYNNGIIASSCMKVSCDRSIADPKLILYMIVWEEGQKKILEGAGGSTRTSINIGPFSDIQLYLPESIFEQHKIAEILTAVDDAIEQTEALIHKYQRIKQGLMQDLLTRGVDENGELRPYPNMRPDLYKRSELGWIPTGWKIQKISDFAIVKGGKRLPVGAQFEEDITPFPYIRVTDFYDFTVDPSSIKYISTDLHEVIKRYVISISDVYISIAGTIGLTGTIPEKLDGANLTENAARITQINGVNNRFLAYFLGSYLAQKQISALIGTTTQPKLALERIEQIRVLIPNSEEQTRIIKVLNAIIGTIDRIQKEQKKLLSLKQGLMQDLLTGKVRVNALLEQ